jgi:hypothetical protein
MIRSEKRKGGPPASSLQEIARANQCKAVAIVFDVAIELHEPDRKSNAIQVCLEHADGYSAEVFFPYQVVNHELLYGKTFAQEGKHDIFAGD